MTEAVAEFLFSEYGARCGVLGGEDFSSCVTNRRRAEGFLSAFVAVFPYYFCGSKGKISMYARFADYHGVLTEALTKAAETFLPEGMEYRVCADISPLNEVRAAALAGLGCVGKNGLLITPEYGSYVFIGEILLPVETETEPGEITSCIGCGACEKACPTGALANRGVCLSELTQKKRLAPDEEEILRENSSQWGCDICQLVCPMNAGVKKTAIPEFMGMTVSEVKEFDTLGKTDGEILDLYRDRAFTWRGAAVLRRNQAIVSGEGPSPSDQSQSGGR